jgi:hypothetical protein
VGGALIAKILRLALLVGVGGLVYLSTARLLGCPEPGALMDMLRRRKARL